MFKNYLKVGIRNMSKNMVASPINVFGLALAVGVAITVFVFIDYQYNVDSFHSNYDNIYEVINHVKEDDEVQLWGDSPILLGPEMLSNHSEVKRMARIEYQRGNIRYGDNVFNEVIAFTDPDFMRIFDYPLLYGNKAALDEKQQIVISKEYAEKYFAGEDPMGKEMSIKFTNNEIRSYLVGAVFDEFPKNMSFGFDVMIPISNFFDLELKDNYNWADLTDATFVELYPDRNPLGLESAMDQYVEIQNATDSKWPIEKFQIWPLATLALNNFLIYGSTAEGSHPAGRIALSVIAILLLTLACFNYMNLALASATKRLKEIALRKVFGSARRGIINQFLIENVLLCLFALMIGTALSYLLILPGLNSLIPVTIPFVFSSAKIAILFFVGLLIIIGLASGAYPAFYISRFQPVRIFAGKQKFGRKNVFSKILLTFQFIIAFTTVIGSFVFTDNAMYLKEKDWGYNQANVMSIPVSDSKTFDGLRDKALQNKDITSIAGAKYHIARAQKMTTIDHLESQFAVMSYEVGFNYLETMNIRLLEGRFFEDSKASDLTQSIVVSKDMVEKLGFQNPLEEKIKFDSINYRIIGVVDNFYYNDFFQERHPVFFRMASEEEFSYMVLKSTSGSLKEVNDYMKAAWLSVAPNDPYDGKYQDDVFQRFYNDNEGNIIIIGFVSVVAIILASIGLFGLLSLNTTKRLKEFSIRKALGAGQLSIIKLANKDYMWMVLISFFVGAPIGYLLIMQLINKLYTDPQGSGWTPFILALLIMLFTIVLTVSGQVLKASRANPAENLRTE